MTRQRFTLGTLAQYASLPETPDHDMLAYIEIGDGSYRRDNLIETASEYEPALDRWSDMRVPSHRHMRSVS